MSREAWTRGYCLMCLSRKLQWFGCSEFPVLFSRVQSRRTAGRRYRPQTAGGSRCRYCIAAFAPLPGWSEGRCRWLHAQRCIRGATGRRGRTHSFCTSRGCLPNLHSRSEATARIVRRTARAGFCRFHRDTKRGAFVSFSDWGRSGSSLDTGIQSSYSTLARCRNRQDTPRSHTCLPHRSQNNPIQTPPAECLGHTPGSINALKLLMYAFQPLQ